MSELDASFTSGQYYPLRRVSLKSLEEALPLGKYTEEEKALLRLRQKRQTQGAEVAGVGLGAQMRRKSHKKRKGKAKRRQIDAGPVIGRRHAYVKKTAYVKRTCKSGGGYAKRVVYVRKN